MWDLITNLYGYGIVYGMVYAQADHLHGSSNQSGDSQLVLIIGSFYVIYLDLWRI